LKNDINYGPCGTMAKEETGKVGEAQVSNASSVPEARKGSLS
jgi:hypothetical protein